MIVLLSMNQKVGRVTPCAQSAGQCTNGAQGTDAPYPLPGSWSRCMRTSERVLPRNPKVLPASCRQLSLGVISVDETSGTCLVPRARAGWGRGLPPSRRAIAPLRRDGGQAASPSEVSWRSGNSATSQACAGRKRRKRRAPFVRVATTLNTYDVGGTLLEAPIHRFALMLPMQVKRRAEALLD